MGEHVRAGDLDIWTEQVGQGPDVLLIGGLGDTVDRGNSQLDGLADRYRLTAFDNRGAGRTAMPPGPVSVEQMADDAARVLGALDIPSAHVAGFSGEASSPRSWRCATPTWSAAWSCRAPGRQWTPTSAHGSFPSAGRSRSLRASAPSWRVSSCGSTRLARTTTALSTSSSRKCWPSAQADDRGPAPLYRHIDAFVGHDTTDRLPQIAAPTLVLASGRDSTARPPLGRAVADRIPGARFEIMEEEAHQPFQEIPNQWNDRVDAFWREIEAQG